MTQDDLTADGGCLNSVTDQRAVVAFSDANADAVTVYMNTNDDDTVTNDTGINILIDAAYVINSLTTTIDNVVDNTAQNVESFYYPNVLFGNAFKSIIQITRTADSKIFNFVVEKDKDSNELKSITFNSGPLTSPEIDITGNATSIGSGDVTPDIADDTDFGSVGITGCTNPNTFTINNSGSAVLNLTNATRVTIGGTHAADFALTSDAGCHWWWHVRLYDHV